MTDIVSFISQHVTFVVGAAATVSAAMAVLAAAAWRLLNAERKRHSASHDLAAKPGETRLTFERSIGMPLQELEESLHFLEQKTEDIVATVTAFQRLYAANRDFTVTPELLFELKDLTKSVDSRELVVELPERIQQALEQVSNLSANAQAT